MQIRYFCRECKRNKAITVPTRGENEDIKHWIELVSEAIGSDHSTYSPHCTCEHCDVVIGLEEGKPIGDADHVAPPSLISKMAKEGEN
jgi:hypothetical protein